MDVNDIYPIQLENKLRKQAGDLFDEIKAVSYDSEKLYARIKLFLTSPAYNLFYNIVTEEQISNTVMNYQNIFAWNKTKQVYRFDDDLWNTIQSVEKAEVHCAVFDLLPFPTFWIDREFENGFAGCMFNRLDGEVWFSFLRDDDIISYLKIPYTDNTDGATIEDLLEGYDIPEWFFKNLHSALNAVIYLCTTEPDISTTKVELPTIAKRTTKKPAKQAGKKNTVKIGNVGANVGRIIREYEERERRVSAGSVGTGKKGTKKSPHIRKAHYHSYWIKENGEKQLIVKFLSPIFVHGESKNIKPTIRKRKKK